MAQYEQYHPPPDPVAPWLQWAVGQYGQQQQANAESDAADQAQQQRQAALELQRQQLAQTGQYQQGQLGIEQSAQEFSQNKDIAEKWLTSESVMQRIKEGDPSLAADAAQFAKEYPKAAPFVAAVITNHFSQGQQAAGVEQQYRHGAAQDVAGGSTDPNKVNLVTRGITGSYMPPEGFKQQQASDLGARAGQVPPAPTMPPAPQQGPQTGTSGDVQAMQQLIQEWQDRLNKGDTSVRQEAAQYIQAHPEAVQAIAQAAQAHAQTSQPPPQQAVPGNPFTAAAASTPSTAQPVSNALPPGSQPAPPLTARVPTPSGGAVADYEARQLGAMPTAAENQTTQTQQSIAAGAQAGETKRTAMKVQGEKDLEGMRIQAQQNAANALTSGLASSSGDLKGAPAIVQMLVNRTYDPSLMRRWKPEQQQAILSAVRQYDPNFDMASYPTQVQTKKAFTSGPYSQAATSVNQLIGHINTLNDTYGKINNTKYPALNAVENWMAKQGGSDATQGALGSFNTAADAVANEAARVFKGSGATAEKEIASWRDTVSPNMSPEAFKGSVDTLFSLLGSRLSSMNDTYQKGVGRPPDFQILSPKSRVILQHRFGKNPDDFEGGNATQPSGTPPAGTPSPGEAWAQKFMSQNP